MSTPVDTESLRLPAAIIGEMSDSEFFASYWRRRFVHAVGGANALVELMPTIDDVEALIDRPGHVDRELARFISFPPSGQPIAEQWAVGVVPAHGRDRNQAVNLAPAATWFPELIPLAAAVQRCFGAPANLQLFWGPPGGGLNPHFDTNDSFVIQIAGSKRWFGTDVTDARPSKTGSGAAQFETEPDIFDLEPGDVLYKPSHAAHSTSTTGDTPALSLTCSIMTRTAGDLVVEAIRQRLAADPVWFERIPMVHADGSDDDLARPRIEAALNALAADMPTLPDLERLADS